MPKDRFSVLPKQSPSPSNNTSSFINAPHPNIEDENHICPVCDGDCTCNINFPSSSSSPPPLLPSLKIKLTVPQRMLGKPRAPLPPQSLASTSTARISNNSPHPPPQKRRGRPPKAVVAARQLAATSSLPDHHPHHASPLRPKPSLPSKQKQKSLLKKSAASIRKGKARSIDLSSAPSDHESDDDDGDSRSGRFPTFVSASGLSSRASSSSSSSSTDDLSDFDDSDSSIKVEEENYILTQIQDREARHRRDLLGDEPPKKRDPHNTWIIRPRKRSVGPSDVEMDMDDSDATVDDDDDQEEDDEQDNEDDEDVDAKIPGNGYIGMATGWSEEDEESSFDADLFFASLHDSEGEGEADDHQQLSCTSGDEGDHSDMDSVEASTPVVPSMPPEFEVTEGWDGQIMFTNGFRDGQGMVDMHFEAHAATLAESSSSPSSEQSDMDMNIDTAEDDEGYEQDVDQGDGDTTDEELVGDDDLPNERAMSLFSLPLCVSAINPMSTMSPAVSPAPFDRRPFSLLRCLDSSPNPADILSGKVFCDSDDDESANTSGRRRFDPPGGSIESEAGAGPRTGHFEIAKGSRQAVINDLHKDIPSPHPRFRRRKGSSTLHGHQSVASLAELSLQSPVSVSSTPFHDEVAMTSSDMTGADIVDLNDVLEASFMDPEPSDHQSASTDNESRSKQQAKNFNHRWDLMSASTFRQNRTVSGAAGWGSPSSSTPATKTNYGSMMKSSPLSTMLWQNKAGESRRRSRKKSVVISPVILPVHDRDGDRTPTNTPPYNQPPPLHNRRHHDHYPQRSRKELRRERKLQRKSYGSVHHQHLNHQHHNYHHHHPNLKTRSTSSLQRMNFSSSVPPLNL